MMHADPFDVLGLELSAGLSDDDVRAAWRRVAAATHPDRDDGGDPARFAAAAAAYTALRTAAARGEALADRSAPGPSSIRHSWIRHSWIRHSRIRRGWLALRLLVAAGVSVLTVVAIGWLPAAPAIITGVLTWLVLTGRGELPHR
jgi:DnaJ domain